MTQKSIFEFLDYKAYLRAEEDFRKAFLRGFRTRLAEQIDVQPGFVSQILTGPAHFSLEQGLKAAKWLELQGDEQKFFLLLIDFARAGSADLKQFFREQINELREKNLNISQRVAINTKISEEIQNKYYSQWYYTAIHILVSIPGLRTVDKISQTLRLKPSTTKRALQFLVENQLIEERKGEFILGQALLNLEKQSVNIAKHHANWRQQAIARLSEVEDSDIHYSTVSSLSEADFEKLRAKITEVIADYVATIGPSKEEMLANFNIDFYRMS